MQLEMEEVGQRAAHAHLQTTLQNLGEREAELKTAFVELQKKHNQIKEFSKLVVCVCSSPVVTAPSSLSPYIIILACVVELCQSP